MVKKSLADNQGVDKAVFDPSHRKAGSYWQWPNVALDATWDRVAEAVHKAWPAKMGTLEDQAGIYFGVLDEDVASRWFYRVYPGGRDSFGRPGRYFFVIFRLKDPEQVLLPEVSGFLNYFDTNRDLPLNTKSLDEGITPREPDDLLRKLRAHWVSRKFGDHWGMDGRGTIIRFAQQPNRATPQIENSHLGAFSLETQPTGRIFIAGLPFGPTIGLVAVGLLLGVVLDDTWGYHRGFRDRTNTVVPPPKSEPPATTNSVPAEPERSNERLNSKDRKERQSPGKETNAGPATKQNHFPPTK